MRELFDRTVLQILNDHISTEAVLAAETSDISTALWQVFEDNGVTMALASEEHGGSGARWFDICGGIIACGNYSVPLPVAETVFANWLLSKSGIQPPEGPVVFAESDRLTIDSGKVSGRLSDVPWGGSAGHIVALTNDATPALVLLSGGEVQSIEKTRNTAAEPRDMLTFDNACPIAVVPLSSSVTTDVLRMGGALIRSAQMAGSVERVLQMAVDYANERVQFGKPIGKFQAVQHQMALVAEQASLARSATETAFSLSEQALDVTSIAVAKICASEAATAAANITHGVHGAIGFTHEYPLHIATRRLWSWRSEFGSVTYWSTLLGQQVCRQGSQDYWASIVNGDTIR
ncbi:acyl-CoA dehydrogenase family protein [Halioxenophilus aromaticivorans]|uniref:Acyl-CoA dehydrogenase family protein n=1 Tax=Halioxenophilus aromaticivorans TaxID=1306992 RepID=A0AAV3U6U6_9ALTE